MLAPTILFTAPRIGHDVLRPSVAPFRNGNECVQVSAPPQFPNPPDHPPLIGNTGKGRSTCSAWSGSGKRSRVTTYSSRYVRTSLSPSSRLGCYHARRRLRRVPETAACRRRAVELSLHRSYPAPLSIAIDLDPLAVVKFSTVPVRAREPSARVVHACAHAGKPPAGRRPPCRGRHAGGNLIRSPARRGKSAGRRSRGAGSTRRARVVSGRTSLQARVTLDLSIARALGCSTARRVREDIRTRAASLSRVLWLCRILCVKRSETTSLARAATKNVWFRDEVAGTG